MPEEYDIAITHTPDAFRIDPVGGTAAGSPTGIAEMLDAAMRDLVGARREAEAEAVVTTTCLFACGGAVEVSVSRLSNGSVLVHDRAYACMELRSAHGWMRDRHIGEALASAAAVRGVKTQKGMLYLVLPPEAGQDALSTAICLVANAAVDAERSGRARIPAIEAEVAALAEAAGLEPWEAARRLEA